MEAKTERLQITGIDCANCAAKVERGVANVTGIEQADLDFAGQKLYLTYEKDAAYDETYQAVVERIQQLEPDVQVIRTVSAEAVDPHQQAEHDHSHPHEHGPFLNRTKKIQYSIGMISFIGAFFVPGSIDLLFFTIAYFLIGWDVLRTAVRNIRHGQVFDENFLMVIATAGAFLIGEYPEAVAVMLFYQVGEFFQHRAVDQSRKSIAALMDIRPDIATLEDGRRVSPEQVNIGQRILVRAGEKIPLDGTVLEGEAFIDTTALTGESVPRRVRPTEPILAGTINTDGHLLIQVDRRYGESTVAKILDLVENASRHKAPTEKFITRFARVYTPIVVVIATLLAIVPPLVVNGAMWNDWIYRALVFLVISCPCALVISIPLGFFSGIGAASKRGILVKGGNHLEALQQLDTVVFDKTGTLTEGVFEVVELNAVHGSEDELLRVAATVEQHSNHPIAKSIQRMYARHGSVSTAVQDYQEVAGSGVAGRFGTDQIQAGNARWFNELGLTPLNQTEDGTYVHVARNDRYLGYIRIADRIKDTTVAALRELKTLGIRQTIMLTGDRRETAERIGQQIGITQVKAELLPDQKVEQLEAILDQAKGRVAFVGDGINDAPVLTRADVGIAMGGLGSDVAIEAADVVLMTDEPKQLVEAIRIARATRRIVYQNIAFALGIKGVFLLLGAFGVATMWEAVFADVGVTVLAVLNAMRILRK
ncbi:heavy metal translocating P-type ATPase [Exiguobacterium sp. RIT594]|uniref:heavy metal translocating P-type ATPase n=1 Tax=Exiguobacterium sp. RIT594 TaxID=2282449 RepID=UPI000DF8366D|nr:heavy metal translocating P-type ATPase [Exiguobacterium sp. RIT594]RDB32588.1 cadmium-translocating P-type ATPase [Exiguobacterium sp. RIT594]